MRQMVEQILLAFSKGLIESFMDDNIGEECPHCNQPLNLPDEEDIENWLKGEK